MIDPATVLTALEAETLDVKTTFDDGVTIWTMSFQIEGTTQPALLLLLPDSDYFICVSPAAAPRKQSLNDMPATKLVELLRANSAVQLAKLEHHDVGGGTFFMAVSDCSVEGFTGRKLRRRLEASAMLAARVAKLL